MNTATRPAILDATATLADATRCRLLDLVDRHELTVSELCAVLQLPQSTVSRHLKTLADGGWVRVRPDGTSRYYGAADRPPAREELWRLVRGEVEQHPLLAQDRRRLEGILGDRRSRTQEFFASAGGQWDLLRDDLFGPRFDLLATLELLDPSWVVGDLACGTGRIARALAPVVDQVVAVDGSAAMLAAARGRLKGLGNVEVREGQLEALPMADETLDVATLFLALHHAPDPTAVLVEARRVLRSGGRLLLVDMDPHDREEMRREMGHVWLGFSRQQIDEHLRRAGFSTWRVRSLPAPPAATGPTLFVAAAQKSKERTKTERSRK